MKVLGGLAAIVLLAVLVIPAFAYDGHGSDNLPCTEGGYWVINHLDGAAAPVLTVDGVQATLVKQPNDGIAHYESVPVTADSVVTVEPNIGQLQLSHCIGEPSPEPSASATTPPPSASPTPEPSTVPTPKPTKTPKVTPPPTDTE